MYVYSYVHILQAARNTKGPPANNYGTQLDRPVPIQGALTIFWDNQSSFGRSWTHGLNGVTYHCFEWRVSISQQHEWMTPAQCSLVFFQSDVINVSVTFNPLRSMLRRDRADKFTHGQGNGARDYVWVNGSARDLFPDSWFAFVPMCTLPSDAWLAFRYRSSANYSTLLIFNHQGLNCFLRSVQMKWHNSEMNGWIVMSRTHFSKAEYTSELNWFG